MTTNLPTTRFCRNMLLMLIAGCALNYVPGWAMAGDADPETKAKVQATLNKWGSLAPDYLQRPENQALLREIKALATDRQQDEARGLMMKVNDEDTIRDTLVEFHSLQPRRRSRARLQLMAAANPDLIMRLYDDVFKDENPRAGLIGECIVEGPISMGAAAIIRDAIIANDAFSPGVKDWAKHLSYVDPSLRTQVRAWLDKNKDALARGEYSATVIAQ